LITHNTSFVLFDREKKKEKKEKHDTDIDNNSEGKQTRKTMSWNARERETKKRHPCFSILITRQSKQDNLVESCDFAENDTIKKREPFSNVLLRQW
jgi:hypothetical protein